MPSIWAVIPAKNLDGVKQRLAPVLAEEERRALFQTMLMDVLGAVTAVSELAGVMVVTGDAAVAARAREARAEVLHESANQGHTAAVTAGARHLLAQGADGLLTVPGDLPLVTPEEIRRVLAAHGPGRAITIVPAHDRRGSNCIVCSPPDALPFAFGDDSFGPHLDAARRAGITPTILPIPGIGLDIDGPTDLQLLLERPTASQAQAYLHDSGIAARLQAAREMSA